MTYATVDDLAHNDEVLARQAAEDKAAFTQLYRRHFPRVYRYHLVRTGNHADAQDLTAQTFMAALESLDRYRQEGCFLAWLLGIARKKVALHFRSRKPHVPLEVASELPDLRPLPEAAASQRIQLERITQALKNLAPDRSEAITLCIFGDLTAGEAGLVMGKAPAAVKMLVYRGLKDLRQRTGLAFSEEE